MLTAKRCCVLKPVFVPFFCTRVFYNRVREYMENILGVEKEQQAAFVPMTFIHYTAQAMVVLQTRLKGETWTFSRIDTSRKSELELRLWSLRGIVVAERVSRAPGQINIGRSLVDEVGAEDGRVRSAEGISWAC